jgi:hypothetical protein
VWQALRSELVGQGVEIVTVSLDTGGVASAGPFIDAASPDHPSLIDEAHVSAARFGFVNVPNAVWIDENGTIVRPSHAATVNLRASSVRDVEITPEMGIFGDVLTQVKQFTLDPVAYRSAIADWVEHGAGSRYAMSPDEVVAASRPRSTEHAEAAAAFELAQHLHRAGHVDDAVAWFELAHDKHPENWTYKRQAWTFVTTPPGQASDLLQGPNDTYGTDWLSEVKRIGADSYYDTFDY